MQETQGKSNSKRCLRSLVYIASLTNNKSVEKCEDKIKQF